MIPAQLYYTEDHEWVRVEGDIATVGITDHAVKELGDIVFVDLPEVGSQIEQMAEFGSVESVKTVSGLFLPVSGEVVAVNADALSEPAVLNDSPYEDGWLIQVRMADPKELEDLLSAADYKTHLESL
ncbi:MAG: glycine cleavage system protein GcvH [Candidatus Margulisiibacteriota bacterium]